MAMMRIAVLAVTLLLMACYPSDIPSGPSPMPSTSLYAPTPAIVPLPTPGPLPQPFPPTAPQPPAPTPIPPPAPLPPDPPPPLVNMYVSVNAGLAYGEMRFGTATVPRADQYFWDFGDGDHARTLLPSTRHRYARGGEYRVRVTALDEDEKVLGLGTGVVRFSP